MKSILFLMCFKGGINGVDLKLLNILLIIYSDRILQLEKN